jgi:hypothetical protein
MSVVNKCLQLASIALCAGMTFAVLAGAENASASDLSYCRHRYGPSLADIVRGVEGTPCGIECTASHNARWAMVGRCIAMREQARRHAE